MADSIAKFHDAQVRPPRGGWAFPIGGQLVEKHSEADILEAAKAYRKNNGTYVSDEAITREMWAYWCSRQPERCGATPAEAAATVPLVPRDLKPEVMGPWIWQFLNLAAARWNPSLHGWFIDLCDTILMLLDCPVCRSEWSEILQTRSPGGLDSRLAVCQWVNWAHNQVNSRKGKAEYAYLRMVTEYGAPMP